MSSQLGLSQNTNQTQPFSRQDYLILWGGILFSLIFTTVIYLSGRRLESVPLLPDQGAAWYYWKLPNPTFLTHATAWGLYLAHQITIWVLLWRAKKAKLKYSDRMHWFNWAILGANAAFIVLHLIQTQIWYDGLAQDVSVFSSQGSVIVMLVWILLMENSRRGLFFGKKAPISKEIMRWAREYHGYFFAWATIYTFWFHPMVNPTGHLIGFFYMFLLLLQGSLIYTRVHINKWWTVSLEVIVAVNGTLVALVNANSLWQMFAFGFAAIFVVTQMWGLGLKTWSKIAILAGYGAAIILVFSQVGFSKIYQITWIPIIEYGAVFLLAGIIGLGLLVARQIRGRNLSTLSSPG